MALERHKRFAAHLERVATDGDRAALAALRRGLGKEPGEAPEMYRYVVPWVRGAAPAREERAHYLVAALFAWHCQGEGASQAAQGAGGNLGASLDTLAPYGSDGRESVERRFVGLLNSHVDDVPEHLRHAVGLLRGKGIAVDWAQLLWDVERWGWEGRDVQREWARAYWGRAGPEEESTPSSVAVGLAENRKE